MQSDNTRGALMMMLGMMAFTISDACMKRLSDDLPLSQMLVLRGIGVTGAFLVLCWRMGALRWPARPDGWLILWRTLAEIAAAWLFLTALFHMPLANMTAILQTLPLLVTLGAAVLFGEALGWRRLLAIVTGFSGVLLIVRPGTEGFNVFSVLAILSVLCVAARELVTRRLSASVPSLLVALCTAGGVTVFGATFAWAEDWAVPDAAAWGLLGVSTICLIAGYLMSVMAVRTGELGFVTPFRYTALVWALLLGWAVFGDFPDGVTLAGCAIIAATGIYTIHRERVLRRRTAAAAGVEGPG